MKKIIVFVILITTVIGTIIFIYKNNYVINSEYLSETGQSKAVLKKINSIEEYYILKSCISKYYFSIVNYNSSNLQEDRYYYLQNIYNLIDNEYLVSKNIGINDILSLVNYKDNFDLNIEHILVAKNNDYSIYIFFVKGNLRSIDSNDHQPFYMIVKQDEINKTFSILPYEYIEDKNLLDLKEGQKIEIQFPEKIEKNNINIFGVYNAKFEYYVEDILRQIKEDLTYNQDRAYELLDPSLKITKYRNIEEFKDFIKSKQEDIFLLNADNCTFDFQFNKNIYIFSSNNSNFKIQVSVKNVIDYTYKIIE